MPQREKKLKHGTGGRTMNDRYLFKAKRVDNGEWVQGVPFEIEGKTVILIKDNENLLRTHYLEENMWTAEIYAIEVDPSTICQCTGLKDKNGNLIWENDIVELLGHRGVIKFTCGGFGIGYRKNIDWEEIQANIMRITGCGNILYACENDNYISLWEIYWNFNDEDDSVNTVEVIGNIFDNPDLLEMEV